MAKPRKKAKASPRAKVAASPFQSANTPGFGELLERLGVSLAVTTYQAGKLMLVRSRDARVSTLLRTFERPMGLAIKESGELALGTRNQVWYFRNAPDIARQMPPAGQHDACFLPRRSHVTGDIRGHELAWAGDDLWIVNTFFSTLCVPDAHFSFVPRWSPYFLPKPAPGDQCHLNGLAIKDGKPAFVTALGETTSNEGWRAGKAAGGILMSVEKNAVLCRGLSMPHSPRWYLDRLWLLESGTGELVTVDPETGQKTAVVRVPGFARGLAFVGRYAFIGLSRIRETSTFGDLPIAAQSAELKCGIWVIDLPTGQIVQFMQFQAGVEEIFAVEALPGMRFPELVGFQDDAAHGTFVIP